MNVVLCAFTILCALVISSNGKTCPRNSCGWEGIAANTCESFGCCYTNGICHGNGMAKNAGKCPKKGRTIGRKCYALINGNQPRVGAVGACARRGAMLATIDSREENEFVARLLKGRDTWIAGGVGAPNKISNQECITMKGTGGQKGHWYAANCRTRYPWLCEYDVAPPPTPAPTQPPAPTPAPVLPCEWVAYTGTYIAMNNIVQYKGPTLDECKAKCLKEPGCVSLDYMFPESRCYLSLMNHEEAVQGHLLRDNSDYGLYVLSGSAGNNCV